MSTPVQQNNAPVNAPSPIPTTRSSGQAAVGSALPTLGTTSPLYERVLHQLGGGHVFRLQRNGTTFAVGILENDINLNIHAQFLPAATAQLVQNAAAGVGTALGNKLGSLAGRAAGRTSNATLSNALSAGANLLGRSAGALATKLLSANKAASALAWDFSDGQYWENDLRFTLIRVGTSGEQSVVQRYYDLAEAVVSQESNGVFTGPYGMTIDGQFGGSLGVSLLVGNWLTVDDLVVTNISADFSRVITVDGKPYMAGLFMHVKTRTAISHNVDLKRYLGV